MPTDPALPDRMADVAAEFLAALDGRGRACAQLPFTDEDERTRWFYTPILRAGLPLRDMHPGQQRHAHRLLALGLSAPGYVTASTIMGLENTLDAEEGFIRDWYPGRGRDPQMYYLSVFGDPGGRGLGLALRGPPRQRPLTPSSMASSQPRRRSSSAPTRPSRRCSAPPRCARSPARPTSPGR